MKIVDKYLACLRTALELFHMKVAGESAHLDSIIEKRNQIANLQVVFVDVEKYSQRKSPMQVKVIDAHTQCLTEALQEIPKKYSSYAQENNLNFQNDIITVPTGDGAAIIFSFDGLHDIHLSFALKLLEKVHQFNSNEKCQKFFDNGWCDCHPNFNVRIGISEGKGIIFKDMNDHYNVAGNVINMASRIMELVDRNQIAFTQEAYKQLVDMMPDPNIANCFVLFENIKLKHGVNINMYQYTNSSLKYLNSDTPDRIKNMLRARKVWEEFVRKGFIDPKRINKDTTLLDDIEKLGVSFLPALKKLEALMKQKGLSEPENK